MSLDRFLDFMATLSSPELATIAGIRGERIAGYPRLIERIAAFQQTNGFEITDPNNNLTPPYDRVAVGAVKYDEERDIARFDRQAGEKAFTSLIDNTPLKPEGLINNTPSKRQR